MLNQAYERERELVHGELQVVPREPTVTARLLATPQVSFLTRHGEFLCACIAGVLLLTAATYSHMTGHHDTWYHILVMIAFALGFFYGAAEAWGALRQGKLDIHFLMVLGALLALFVGSEMEGAILLFLFTLSGSLEEYAMQRTHAALESLMKLFPKEATVLNPDGTQRLVKIDEIQVGEQILIKPGDSIAADGTILEGESAIDESAITGEYLPREKGPGQTAYAGTLNTTGRLILRVDKHAHDTTLAKIIHLVSEAREEKAPVERLFDRIGTVYTIGVLSFSVLAAVVLHYGFGHPWVAGAGGGAGQSAEAGAIYRAITLLIVASPCALIISTPVVLLSAIASCARRGIVLKGGRHLESLAALKALVFDKTGTLTAGKVQLVGIEYVSTHHSLLHCDLPGVVSDHPYADEHGEPALMVAASVRDSRPLAEMVLQCQRPCDRHCARPAELARCEAVDHEPAEVVRLLLRVAYSMEANSSHPLAAAVTRAAKEAEIEAFHIEEFKQQPGQGLRAMIDGELAILGSPQLLDGLCHTLSVTRLCQRVQEIEAQGQTAVVLHYAGRTGLFRFQDVLRPDAREMIDRLHDVGVRPLVMLTGDNRRTAEHVAAQVGVDEVRSELLPADKLHHVEDLVRKHRYVGMVGDGINDAPALARATVGIAMGSIGSDAALQAADVVLLSDRIDRLPWLIATARRARRVMAQNLTFSLLVIVVLIVASLSGSVGLPLGVIGHEGSTVLVVLNGLRLLVTKNAER